MKAAQEARKLDEVINPIPKTPALPASGTVQKIDPKTGKPALSEFGAENLCEDSLPVQNQDEKPADDIQEHN